MFKRQDGYQGPTGPSHVLLAYRAGEEDGKAGRKMEPPRWVVEARMERRGEWVLWERAYGNGWEQGRREQREKTLRVGAGVAKGVGRARP